MFLPGKEILTSQLEVGVVPQKLDTSENDAEISAVGVLLLLRRIVAVAEAEDQLVDPAGPDFPDDDAVVRRRDGGVLWRTR